MKVKRGDVVESEFGVGKIVAITKEWVIHETDGGGEVAMPRDEVYITLKFPKEDVDKSVVADIDEA